jgi:hypothetical protein
MKKQAKPFKSNQSQVTFRISGELRKFYEDQAEAERRKLSEMLRIVLEDHKPILEARQQTT